MDDNNQNPLNTGNGQINADGQPAQPPTPANPVDQSQPYEIKTDTPVEPAVSTPTPAAKATTEPAPIAPAPETTPTPATPATPAPPVEGLVDSPTEDIDKQLESQLEQVQPEAPKEPGGGKGKMYIIIAVAVLVLLSAAYIVYAFVLSDDAETTEETAEENPPGIQLGFGDEEEVVVEVEETSEEEKTDELEAVLEELKENYSEEAPEETKEETDPPGLTLGSGSTSEEEITTKISR